MLLTCDPAVGFEIVDDSHEDRLIEPTHTRKLDLRDLWVRIDERERTELTGAQTASFCARFSERMG